MSAAGLININLASPELPDTLPSIGPVLAQAIVDYRENVRLFGSIAEIQEVLKIVFTGPTATEMWNLSQPAKSYGSILSGRLGVNC